MRQRVSLAYSVTLQYGTVELECLAIINAIQKCHYYLAGVPKFEVWTDHRPLVGAFGKHLHTMTNQRLLYSQLCSCCS